MTQSSARSKIWAQLGVNPEHHWVWSQIKPNQTKKISIQDSGIDFGNVEISVRLSLFSPVQNQAEINSASSISRSSPSDFFCPISAPPDSFYLLFCTPSLVPHLPFQTPAPTRRGKQANENQRPVTVTCALAHSRALCFCPLGSSGLISHGSQDSGLKSFGSPERRSSTRQTVDRGNPEEGRKIRER